MRAQDVEATEARGETTEGGHQRLDPGIVLDEVSGGQYEVGSDFQDVRKPVQEVDQATT